MMRHLSRWITIAVISMLISGCGILGSDKSKPETEQSDANQTDSAADTEEAQEESCHGITRATPVEELDSCDLEDDCWKVGAEVLDVDKIAASEDSCGEIRSDSERPYSKGTIDFCIREEWSSGSPSSAVAGYYDETQNEWKAYVLSSIPWDADKMEFLSCDEIPEEAENARDACLDCESVWKPLPG